MPLHAGTVVDTSGHRLGVVPAVELVTVGQRKGVGLPGGGPARYVVDVDVAEAVVTVGSAEELLVDARAGRGVHLGRRASPPGTCSCRPAPMACPARRRSSRCRGRRQAVVVRWHQPQRRVAPGQSVVLYDTTDTFVLGGGVASGSAGAGAEAAPAQP